MPAARRCAGRGRAAGARCCSWPASRCWPCRGCRCPPALAALRPEVVEAAELAEVCSRMRSWRMVGSVIVPLPLARSIEHLGAAAEAAATAGSATTGAGPPGPPRSRRPGGRADRPRCRASTMPPPRRAAARAEAGPLVHEGGVGHGPAVVQAADDGVVGDAGVAEEDLVEHGVAGHLHQRADLDAGLVHVDGELGDALVLGHVGVGAGDEHADVGGLAERGPHLLAVDDPLVAVLDGPGGEAGEVGAGARAR